MRFATILLIAVIPILGFTQETYKIGNTEYYYGQTYSTTGKPLVKRSTANKTKFLRSLGYDSIPEGYEVDHIIPLSEGGSDDHSNMQLLTINEHNVKTARERANNLNSTYSFGLSGFIVSPTYTYSENEYSDNRIIYTGKNGGKYYINSNGNKTYIKSTNSESLKPYTSSSNTYSSTCGALTKSGTYCKSYLAEEDVTNTRMY